MKDQTRGMVVAGIALLCICIIVTSGVMPFLRPAAVYPSIIPVSGAEDAGESEFIFSFENRTYTLSMPVDASVYAGAQSVSKSAILYENLSDEVWMTGYYQAFIDDPHQKTLYDNLLHALSDIRDEKDLDTDRYLEMIAAFVQAIPYQDHPEGTPPKFLVETVAEGTGDCDDKSLLLAALLAGAGYDVVLLDFVDGAHMAVGVASDHHTFGSTDYTYIETTDFCFVGSVPKTLSNGASLTEDPLIIRIGNGTARYTSGDETAYIEMREREAHALAERLGGGVVTREESLRAEEERLGQERESFERKLDAGDTAGYNAGVPAFNEKVAAYNAALRAHRQEAGRYDEAVAVTSTILDHRSDRPGTYRWLLDHPLRDQTTIQTGEQIAAAVRP